MEAADLIKVALEVGTAAIAIGGWLHKKVVVPAREWREGIDGKFEEVLHELKTNGGNSLRDEIRSIRKQVDSSAARFLAFGSESNFGCFITSPEGACTWVNRAYLRITERTEAEVLGWGWKNIIHPDDRERVALEWSEAMEDNREFHSAHRFITPNGEDVPVYVHSRPVHDGSGTVIEHIGFVRGYDDSCIHRADCVLARHRENHDQH